MPSCHSVYDLELAVQDLWAHLPQDNIRCLINSMPDRGGMHFSWRWSNALLKLPSICVVARLNAEYLASERAAETPEQSQARRQQNAEYLASERASETSEQSQARRQQNAEYMASERASETPEQYQARRLQHATYMASQRDTEAAVAEWYRYRTVACFVTETVEAAKSRRRAVAERAQQRRLIFTRSTWGIFDKAAFEYDETLDYESPKLIKIEAMNKECRFCGALKWNEEVAGLCCSEGKVALPSIDERVEPLKELFSYVADESTFSKKHKEIQYMLPYDIFWGG
ncbi:uncharacterized protein TNCV_403271 [Trichonephila clavipes]|nr:uncharacterized protein TNCV_403271 [Trichonephila clavipes]